LQLARPSVEPVPATDGLFHLFYDALVGFTPTGSKMLPTDGTR
jgi:hypothetical protein